MVHYIRFLKLPKVIHCDGEIAVRALITVTTDLGESFFDGRLKLAASIRSADPDSVYLQRTYNWDPQRRTLDIELTLKTKDVAWPVRLHVGPADGAPIASIGPELIPAVVSIWSDYFSLLGPVIGSHLVERVFELLDRSLLHIWEESTESIARHIWDAGLGLVAHLNQILTQKAGTDAIHQVLRAAVPRKLAVIELGSGCGIVGIGLAQLIPNCQVLLTDLQEAEEIISRNIEASTLPKSSSVSFHVLDWEAPTPASVAGKYFDLILVSDCTYNSDSIPALVKTLCDLVERSPGAVVAVSMKVRHASEQAFFELMDDCRLDILDQTTIPLPNMQSSEAGEGNNTVHIYVFGSGRNSQPRAVY